VPKSNPNVGDLTFLVGFVISAVVYYALSMGMRRRAVPS
jgi:hypothetical protein